MTIKEAKLEVLQELYDRMYREAFEKDSDMQKWDSGCWVRFKLFENVVEELKQEMMRGEKNEK